LNSQVESKLQHLGKNEQSNLRENEDLKHKMTQLEIELKHTRDQHSQLLQTLRA